MARQVWVKSKTYYVINFENQQKFLTYGITSLTKAKQEAKKMGMEDGKHYAVIAIKGYYLWR